MHMQDEYASCSCEGHWSGAKEDFLVDAFEVG